MEGQLRMLRPTSVIWCWWASFSRVTQAGLLINGQGTAYFYSFSGGDWWEKKGQKFTVKERAFVFEVLKEL